MADVYISFYLKANRIHVFMDTLRSIGSPQRICFMIEENGRTLLIAPYAQKDFKSHEVPDSVYAGSSSLEINSLRLCSLVAKLHGGGQRKVIPSPRQIQYRTQCCDFQAL